MYGWEGLDNLVAVGEMEVEGTPGKLWGSSTSRIQELQQRFFGSPLVVPPDRVTIHCESTAPVDHVCPAGEPDVIRHGTRSITVRDRRVGNAPTFLKIKRNRFRCRACGQTFVATLPDIREEHRMTRRLHQDLTIASLNRPFAEVARRQSVPDRLVERIFHEYQQAMFADFQVDLPEVVAVDETKLLGEVRFVASDLKEAKILDISAKADRQSIKQFFRSHSYHSNVRVYVQDMSKLFRSVGREVFPHADIVADKFHVIQLATKSMDAARNHFGAGLPDRLNSALRQNAKLFNKNRHNLGSKQRQLLEDILEHSPDLKRAHMLKEEFERIYTYASRDDAERALNDWAGRLNERRWNHVDRWFRKLRRTVARDWRTEVFNFWDHTYTTAYVERMNRSLKEMNRYASGLSFETLRAKAILKYGHYHTMDEIACFDIGGSEEEMLAAFNRRIWRGFSADTLARSLRAGQFEGLPPENGLRPVVLPDGANFDVKQQEEEAIEAAWKEGPAFPVITADEAEGYDYLGTVRRNEQPDCIVSYPLPPMKSRTVHHYRRAIDPNYIPATHFRKRGMGHGGGRGMSLNNPPDSERWARKEPRRRRKREPFWMRSDLLLDDPVP